MINDTACVRIYLEDLGGRHEEAEGRGQAGRKDARRDEIVKPGHLTQNLRGVRREGQLVHQLLT